MATRLERFRQYMTALDVSADPRDPIAAGFYVEPPETRSVADELAARIEINPVSSHIVLGGIGSGKTTQLMVALERLGSIEDTVALFLDASNVTKGLLHPTTGAVVGSLSESVLRGQGGFFVIRPITFGLLVLASQLVEAKKDLDALESITLEFDTLINASRQRNHSRTEEELPLCVKVCDEIRKVRPNIVVFLDAFDRIADLTAFERIIEELLEVHRIGIGVVTTAPLHTLYGTARRILDKVDRFYYLPNVDVSDDHGIDFLSRVLRARVPESVCSDHACQRLAKLSGGVLRDSIALTQSAIEEVYVAGADRITDRNIDTVADAFGRKLLLGLNDDELKILQRVREQGTFVPTTDRDLALQHTRRVLEYSGDRTRYAVHPTIVHLLEQLASA